MPSMSDGGRPPAPLAGIRVLDVSQLVAGPLATRILGELGADVVKVEAPGGELGRRLGVSRTNEDHTVTFAALNFHKRSIVLDLKADEDRRIFDRLAADADVVIHNARPDSEARLGLEFSRLAELNPRVIVIAISGFGRVGPNLNRPAVDIIVQGISGMISLNGFPDQPVRVAATVVDIQTAWVAALGAVSAILQRVNSGCGQLIDVNLYDASLSLQSLNLTEYLHTGEVPVRTGNDAQLGAPAGVFETSDGRIVLSAWFPMQWTRLCELLALPGLSDDARFATNDERIANRSLLNESLESALRSGTTQHWLDLFGEAGITCGPLYDYEQVCASEQTEVSEMLINVASDEHATRTLRSPLKLDGMRIGQWHAPLLDEHHAEITASGFGTSNTETGSA